MGHMCLTTLLVYQQKTNSRRLGNRGRIAYYGNQITTKGITTAAVDAVEGTLYSTTYTVNVSSNILFIQNNDTTLSATAGTLHDTNVAFRENSGVQGGALALLEFATLSIFPGSHLVFDCNYASDVGGAIYATVHDTIDFYYSRNCFVCYNDLIVNTKTSSHGMLRSLF